MRCCSSITPGNGGCIRPSCQTENVENAHLVILPAFFGTNVFPSLASQPYFSTYAHARVKWAGGGKEKYVWADLTGFHGSSSRS